MKICGCKAALRCIGILFNLKSKFVTKMKFSTSAATVLRRYYCALTVILIKQRTGFISWMVIFKLFWMQTRKLFIKAYWAYSKLENFQLGTSSWLILIPFWKQSLIIAFIPRLFKKLNIRLMMINNIRLWMTSCPKSSPKIGLTFHGDTEYSI